MNLINAYSLALLLTEGKFSCVKAAKKLGAVSHDALTRAIQEDMTSEAIADWSTLPKKGTLVWDETVVAKPFSPNMENAQWVHDSAQKRAVRGYKALVFLWVSGKETHILRLSLPGTENVNELVRKTLIEVKAAGLKPEICLFDNWYASCETLNLIDRLNWRYASRVKSNRLFNGRAVKTYKFHGAKGKTGQLKGVSHQVQIVKDGNRYLLTNDKHFHNSVSLSKLYGGRWVIETVFRDLKQVLHLEKCACRSLTAQFNHFLACLEGYVYLRKCYPHLSVEAAQQEVLRLWQQCQPLPQLNLTYAA
jgi:Transposase DDE domain